MVSLVALSLLMVAGLSAAVPTSPALIEDFPSVVQIEFQTGPVWLQLCAGTILTNYHLISVAHCFYGPTYDPRFRQVRVGATYRGQGGQIFTIQTATNNPNFNGRDVEGDLSIIRLNTFLTFDSTVQPSPIVASGTWLVTDTPITFAGWGRTAQRWEVLPGSNDQLNRGDLLVASHGYCMDIYYNLPIYVPITYDMFCVKEPGANGTSLGLTDTGAPIFINGVLAGVVAFGSPIGETYPVIAVLLAEFNRWIIATAV